jgi:DNA-binding CsgD family transcriptional regulator/tetratricopeptide (TPR) repeat protein
MLHEARRGLSRSRAAFVLVGGDAGIGKSRLLAAFSRSMAEGRSRNLVNVECLEYAPAPFGPIRDALERLARSARLALPPLLGRFVTRDISTGTIEKAELFLAVADFFRSCARERATIVTIEDLHWADATTLEFLGYAAPRFAGSRLLLVATYRSNEIERYAALKTTIARLLREPGTFRLELESLAKADVRALIAGALEGQVPLAAQTIANVVARAEGNPFFAEELLKGALAGRDERGRSELPISIRATIVERLDIFSPEERAVVDRAAVLGMRFDPHVLARTLHTTVDAILPTLRKARDANLIVEADDAGRICFRFRHALTRQAVYDELLLFDARRTHRNILETLESFDAESEHLEELAYHAWEARDAEKTLRYNKRAAQTALALFALPEARLGYERALEVATDRSDEAHLLERLGHVTALLGDLNHAIEIYDAARLAAIETRDFDLAAHLTRMAAAQRSNCGDASCVALGLAFLERYGDRVSARAHDDLVALLARLCTISYDVELAATLLRRITDAGNLDPMALQNVLTVRADTAWIRGDVSAWARATETLLDLLPALPSHASLIPSYTIAEGASYHGRDDLAARALAHADRIEARHALSGPRAHGFAVRALDFYSRGKLESARRVMRGGTDAPRIRSATAVLARHAPFIADALDDESLVTPEIEAEFAAARQRARHADDAVTIAAAAFWSLRLGQRVSALTDIRTALGCLPHPIVHADSVILLAAQHLPLAELHALETFTDPTARDAGDTLGRAHALAAAAIVARRRGDPGAAETAGLEAAGMYRRAGRPLDEARALEHAGHSLAARELYERCGAVGWAKRLAVTDSALTSSLAKHALSSRELDVARLMAEGLGNSAIGERLSITTKTVEKHIGSIYDKLGVRSRPQVALLVSGSLKGPASSKSA